MFDPVTVIQTIPSLMTPMTYVLFGLSFVGTLLSVWVHKTG